MAAFGRLLLFSQLARPGYDHSPDAIIISQHSSCFTGLETGA